MMVAVLRNPLRRAAFHGAANFQIRGAAIAWMNAALHTDFGGPARPRLARAACDLLAREVVGATAQIFAELAFGEGAEAAFEVTDVGVIDVAGHDIGDDVAIRRSAHLVSRHAHGRELLAAAAKQP